MQNEFIGQKLRQARFFNGLSMQELGKKVATSRQFIQQLEIMDKSPSNEMILALSDVLAVSPDFFYEYNTKEIPFAEDECHFRSRKTTTEATKQQALTQGFIFSKLVDYLEDDLDLPAKTFPEYNKNGKMSDMDIERVAENARLHWKLGINTPITNMTRVLENAGAVITHFTDVSGKVDAFSSPRKRFLIIRNPEKQSCCRMRFDLAHECGHLIMHTGLITGDTETEHEANRFASAFLLPRNAFFNEFSCLASGSYIPWTRLCELKIRWKVSLAAIIRRAYDLRMIDAAKYRTANIKIRQMSNNGLEPYDDNSIPMECPEILNEAMNFLKEEGRLANILEYLKVRYDFISKVLGDVKLTREDFLPPPMKAKIIQFNSIKP